AFGSVLLVEAELFEIEPEELGAAVLLPDWLFMLLGLVLELELDDDALGAVLWSVVLEGAVVGLAWLDV
ncbi:MAG TPA: hypothetical protein VJ453_03645, partial [Terriglobales bacterium]|nr:hypothetical protein [Terriglobales bacterium]